MIRIQGQLVYTIGMTVISGDDNNHTNGMNIPGTEWEYHGNRIGL